MSHPVAVFVSGTGRHLENFASLAQAGELDVDVRLCVSNKEGVLALERAARFGIDSLVLDPGRDLGDEAFSREAFAACTARGVELVLLAGFLRKLVIPQVWEGKVLNIHPSLLPAFGGKGYWGDRVHQAVLDRGCWFSGCTVHVVDNVYDNGPILLQQVVPVEPGDDVHRLAERVFEAEAQAFPEAVRLHLEGRAR
ncbi:MAG: phosphoribosylglycinamide formyltransferase [Planctomycetota bacterium]|nr:phosphoribosylglycinamide formyltransferase [Planctomycetota bacterium]